jgi:alkanesulfonate monooxygenase SsuD/methylene tetrahydromethanopterin reductase-like flavin-dependent oxidoreductase (luciferase family)
MCQAPSFIVNTPHNQTAQYTDLDYWTNLAKVLEAGKFHGLFLADIWGIYDVYKGLGNINSVLPGAAQFPISDPL